MLQRIEQSAAALLLAAIVVLVSIASVTRYLGSPIIWSIEIAQTLFIWLCMLAADIALQRARHFGIDAIGQALGLRAAAVLRLVNLGLIVILLAVLLVYGLEFTRLSSKRLFGATQLPYALVAAALPFGFCLMLRTLVAQMLDTLRELRGAGGSDTRC